MDITGSPTPDDLKGFITQDVGIDAKGERGPIAFLVQDSVCHDAAS